MNYQLNPQRVLELRIFLSRNTHQQLRGADIIREAGHELAVYLAGLPNSPFYTIVWGAGSIKGKALRDWMQEQPALQEVYHRGKCNRNPSGRANTPGIDPRTGRAMP